MRLFDPFIVAMTAPQGAGSALQQVLIPMALMVAIFYFVLVLPMRKRQAKVQSFLQALKVGDRVVTSGGMFGSITRLSDQSIQLQIANNVRVEVSRAAIVGYQGQEPVVSDGHSPS
jgi:preprotein translocase subunit YajC